MVMSEELELVYTAFLNSQVPSLCKPSTFVIFRRCA